MLKYDISLIFHLTKKHSSYNFITSIPGVTPGAFQSSIVSLF